MAFYGCVKCPSLQAQCLDCFEHEHSALHFSIVHSGNALLHSKYQAFSAEACGLGTRLMFVCESHMCSPRFHAHLFIYACLFTVQMMPGEKNKNEGSLLVRGKLLKRLEPGTPSWSHFRFHVSSCPSPKWPITIISPLVVVMLAREKGREREGERAMLKEPRANEMEAAEISQKIIPYLHSIEIKQHPPWQKVNPLSAWEIESFRWVLLVCGYTQRLFLC